jgi:hypothetical protein
MVMISHSGMDHDVRRNSKITIVASIRTPLSPAITFMRAA